MKSMLYIGPAGWSYPDWKGIVYPARPPSRFDQLAYLASYFNLIEINSTFYRVPAASVTANWAERVAHRRDFQFTVKAFREFTHTRTPARESDVAVFKKAVQPLYDRGRLSSVLIQFPWSFRFSQPACDYITDLIDWFRPFPVSVEVRHGSWGSDSGAVFFERKGTTMCGIDQPRIGNSLAGDRFVTGGAGAYFRLHGRNMVEWFKPNTNRDLRYDYIYSAAELADWVDRVRDISRKVNKTHVVLNNHFRGQAVANALQMEALLSGGKVAAPKGVLDTYPALSSVLERDTSVGGDVSGASDLPSLFEDQDG